MTSEYAPAAIEAAFAELDAAMPAWRLELGGILGSSPSHTYGYHRSRNWDARYSSKRPDYSIAHFNDQAGDGNAASALDVTPRGDRAAEAMATMTRRLVDAIDGGDPRARYIAEVYGTVNGSTVTGRLNGRPASSDDSHLWHLHVAGRRRWADDAGVWRSIVDVILGRPFTYPPDHPKWSDTVTRDEILKLVRAEIVDAERAVLLGGDHGAFTAKSHGLLVKDEGNGVLDRLNRVERAVEPPAK